MLLSDYSYEHFHVAKPGHPIDAMETDIALYQMGEYAEESGLNVEMPYVEESHVRIVRFVDTKKQRALITVMLMIAECGEWAVIRITDAASRQGESIGSKVMERIVEQIIDEQDGETAAAVLLAALHVFPDDVKNQL